jgi:hypothetical protein
MTPAPLQSPIMVVGAGRSGSTLISRMLNAHNAIDFKGETSFLLLRLWVEVWHDRFWLNWPRQVAASPHSAADPLPPMRATELVAERARVGVLVAELLTGLLRVEFAHHRVWGYKELWSGLPQYNHDWSAYDSVIPGAYWVHLVRHPFDFARSCAAWNGTRLTRDYLEARLSNWVDMLACHRRRKDTGRYHEIRVEDLALDPETTLDPVLNALGLSWDPAISTVLSNRAMASSYAHDDNGKTLTSDDAEALIAGIPGLAAAMDSCRYVAPRRTLLSSQNQAESSADLRDPEGERKDSFLPRYALEAQLHHARSSVSDLNRLLSQDALDSPTPINADLSETLDRARLILAQLTDALKQ